MTAPRPSLPKLPLLLTACVFALFLAGADGCASDPNVEGAKLELRNQDYDRVIELTSAALTENPENAEAHFLQGEAYRLQAESIQDAAARNELLSQAAAAYQNARQYGYAAADVDNRLQVAWATEMNFGARAFRRAAEDPNAYNEAVAAFANATVLQPDSSDAYLNQGLALLAAGRTAEAAEPLQAAIDRGESSPEPYIYLGRIYLSEDRASEAMTALERGRELFPENPEIQTELLNAYAATGQVERALGAYQEAIAADPSDPLLRYNYGSLLLQAERYDEAIEHLSEATALAPDNSNAFYNLGAAYQNRAAALNDRLEELEDADAPQADIDAVLRQRAELLEQAVEPLEEARELTEMEGEDPADICRALLQVYASLNRMDEAEEAAACAGVDMN